MKVSRLRSPASFLIILLNVVRVAVGIVVVVTVAVLTLALLPIFAVWSSPWFLLRSA